MKIPAELIILLLQLGTIAAYRHRLKGDAPSITEVLPTLSPTMKPAKVGLKVGKEKGANSNADKNELTEEVPTSAPKGSEPDDAEGLEPKGPPKGAPVANDTEPEPKGVPKGSDTVGDIGLAAKGVPKGPGSNLAPTKKASPPVEVHMIGVKLAPGKKKGNAVIVSSTTNTDSCSERTNMMTKKLGSFASPCILDPSGACVAPVGIKKGGEKRNLKKSSCGTKGSKKSGSKGSKKRHV